MEGVVRAMRRWDLRIGFGIMLGIKGVDGDGGVVIVVKKRVIDVWS